MQHAVRPGSTSISWFPTGMFPAPFRLTKGYTAMPLFDVGSPAFQGPTTVGTAASVKIWSGTVTALAGISPAVTVRDLVVQNVGTAVVYIASGTVNPGLATTVGLGVPVVPGGVLTLQGFAATTNTTTNDMYAVAYFSTGAGSVVAGLGTLISVV